MTDKVLGRPAIYTEELALEICEKIKNSSKGIAWHVKQNPSWPDRSTIYMWLATKKDFLDLYKQAKEMQYEFMGDEIIDIGDESEAKLAEIKHADLRIKTRMWVMERCAAKKYGTKQIHSLDSDTFTGLKKAYDEAVDAVPDIKSY